MRPYYSEQGIDLYCGDCLDVLSAIDIVSERIHVITDPPYEAAAHTKQRRVKGMGGGLKYSPLTFAAITPELRRDFGKWCASTATGWVLIFCQIEAVQLWASAAKPLEYIRTQIWRKPDGGPQLTGDRPGMGYEAICTLHPPGRKRWNGGGRHGVYTHAINAPGMDSTLRACKDLGRRCIGIEMNSDHCALAQRRLSQEVLCS